MGGRVLELCRVISGVQGDYGGLLTLNPKPLNPKPQTLKDFWCDFEEVPFTAALSDDPAPEREFDFRV